MLAVVTQSQLERRPDADSARDQRILAWQCITQWTIDVCFGHMRLEPNCGKSSRQSGHSVLYCMAQKSGGGDNRNARQGEVNARQGDVNARQGDAINLTLDSGTQNSGGVTRTLESPSSHARRGDTSLHLSDAQTQIVLAMIAYLYDYAPFN
jgi:hypothetical protein